MSKAGTSEKFKLHLNVSAAADAASFWVKLEGTSPKVPLDQECAQTPLLYLNEVMMPLEAGFKDTSVVTGSVCTVHWFIFSLHKPAHRFPVHLLTGACNLK